MAIGASLAPTFVLWRLLVAMVAFFLALGIGCHALDELAGRPLGLALSQRALVGLAIFGLGGAIALGILGAFVVSVWLIPLILIGTFLALAYNLELFSGRFHTTLWLGLSWAAFPVITGWFVEARDLRLEPIIIAGACCLMVIAQRRLSTPARDLRRRTVIVEGTQTLRSGERRDLSAEELLLPLESTLAVLWKAMVLLAAGLVVGRL